MGAPVGNKHAAGHDGKNAGRKSAYEEFIQAQWHYNQWITDADIDKLEAKIKSKRYSVRDMYVLRALKGDPRILQKFGDKLMPDLTLMMGAGGGSIEVDLLGEAKKRSRKYEPK